MDEKRKKNQVRKRTKECNVGKNNKRKRKKNQIKMEQKNKMEGTNNGKNER
jgi:hypothetical protein